jgi:hypothetical protein
MCSPTSTWPTRVLRVDPDPALLPEGMMVKREDDPEGAS